MPPYLCPVAATSILSSSVVHAAKGDQTLSIGYAQMNSDPSKAAYSANKTEYESRLKTTGNVFAQHADSDKQPQGMFIRYRYKLDDTWGVMGAITYAVGDMDNHFLSGEKAKNKKDANKIEKRFSNRVKTDYVSLLAGPTLRANEWVSAFGLLGVALHSVENSLYETDKTSIPPKQVSRNEKSSNTSLAYALGLQFNVYKGLVIDAAWAGSGSGDWKSSGFNLGVGYQF
ncbi:Ail/Lom family outer membrane beta-barrel protein [Sodalis glossinidius]|nr:Ail/Lom family outer membrane beta-barrel protein [Sodalis glossinidius]